MLRDLLPSVGVTYITGRCLPEGEGGSEGRPDISSPREEITPAIDPPHLAVVAAPPVLEMRGEEDEEPQITALLPNGFKGGVDYEALPRWVGNNIFYDPVSPAPGGCCNAVGKGVFVASPHGMEGEAITAPRWVLSSWAFRIIALTR